VQHVQDLLFPIEEHPVFVSVKLDGGERRLPVPERKAIINAATQRVLGIVGRDYLVVTNQQALDLGRQCCKALFPDTSAAEWQVDAVDAPRTASYCHIDLVHNSGAVDFSWVPAKARPEVFGPFIRITNSYNLLRALVFDVGFHRKVCRNGLIVPQTVVRFRFSHERRQLRDIRFDVHREELATVTRTFRESMSGLAECPIPKELFPSLVCGVLCIRPPDGGSAATTAALKAWHALTDEITASSVQYIAELGPNAYSLLNTITDFASLPPENLWIRRDRHALQRLVGSWLAHLQTECRKSDFDITAHVKKLTDVSSQVNVSAARPARPLLRAPGTKVALGS